MTHSYTKWSNFGPNFEQNRVIFPNFPKFEPILAQIWENFDPFIYQNLHFMRGHSYTMRLILLPMMAAHPHRIFRTVYPPRSSSQFIVPRTHQVSFADSSLSCFSPKEWNSLPKHINDAQTVDSFKKLLKSYLFEQVYMYCN